MVKTYIESIIVPELNEEEARNRPILKSQAFKFLITFRNYIPRDWLSNLIKTLGFFLSEGVTDSMVVKSYAVCCIEKLLSMKGQHYQIENLNAHDNVFRRDMVEEFLLDLLKAISSLIQDFDGLNTYALVALFRTV